jgi:hypothetical protein
MLVIDYYNGFEIVRDGMGQWAAMRQDPRVQLGWTDDKQTLIEVINNFVADYREFNRAIRKINSLYGEPVTEEHRTMALKMYGDGYNAFTHGTDQSKLAEGYLSKALFTCP